jgi:hippurate hydrolase
MIDVARELVGAENTGPRTRQVMGSEDFSDVLKLVPGAYCTVGHAGDVPLHISAFVLGAALMARMVETRSGAAA